jgi:hypothetical protein
MSGIQQGGNEERRSGAAVFQTLAERASKLKYLSIGSFWTAIGGIENLEGVLWAAACLEQLRIDCSNGGRYLRARRFPPLPPLPVLTELCIPTADLVTTATFAGTEMCKQLRLDCVRAGDLAHVARCIGHSLERLDIWALAETAHEAPPPVFAALHHLTLPRSATTVCLSALFDPATPLETVMIYELSVENFADLQQFYERQPHKTLTHLDIGWPGDISWREPEWARRMTELTSVMGQSPRIAEWKLRLEKARPLLARCVAWADMHGITITAKWYGPEMYEWFGPDMIEGIRAEMRA